MITFPFPSVIYNLFVEVLKILLLLEISLTFFICGILIVIRISINMIYIVWNVKCAEIKNKSSLKLGLVDMNINMMNSIQVFYDFFVEKLMPQIIMI